VDERGDDEVSGPLTNMTPPQKQKKYYPRKRTIRTTTLPGSGPNALGWIPAYLIPHVEAKFQNESNVHKMSRWVACGESGVMTRILPRAQCCDKTIDNKNEDLLDAPAQRRRQMVPKKNLLANHIGSVPPCLYAAAALICAETFPPFSTTPARFSRIFLRRSSMSLELAIIFLRFSKQTLVAASTFSSYLVT